MIEKIRNKIKSNKSITWFMFALFLAQPLLDIFSFFVVNGRYNVITTLLRLFIFGTVTLYAFIIAEKKKPYFIMALVLGVYFAFHMVACFSEGYISIYEDIAMYLRTIQMPVYTLSFITFLKQAEVVREKIGKMFWINFLIITASILLSFLVGRPEYTYASGNGIKGWFFTGNAQSCIISVMAPLGLSYAYRKKNNWLFLFVIAIEFANLYFFGTRVAYYSIFIIGAAFVIFMIWNKEKRWTIYGITIATLAICLLAYKTSPCYLQQYEANQSYAEGEEKIEELLEGKEETGLENFDFEACREVYEMYCEKLVKKFGLEAVVIKYDYSTDIKDLVSNRKLKVNYGLLTMDEKNTLSHLFGFEYIDYHYDGDIFDPENDYPAIYFSYGIVGLGMYVAFLLYFIVIAIIGIVRDKWKISIEKGMMGTALVLMVVAAQMSGNVLRRPNVSIYMSVMLAYLFVLSVEKSPLINRRESEREKRCKRIK